MRKICVKFLVALLLGCGWIPGVYVITLIRHQPTAGLKAGSIHIFLSRYSLLESERCVKSPPVMLTAENRLKVRVDEGGHLLYVVMISVEDKSGTMRIYRLQRVGVCTLASYHNHAKIMPPRPQKYRASSHDLL